MSLRDAIGTEYPDVLFADGFDDAILGVVARCGEAPFVLYDTRKVIECLVNSGLTYEEAWEHFGHNVSGAWVGPATPGFVDLEAFAED